ncbi:MAG TPA: hypothetical protein VHO24_05620 [Opitutaceae bacterium]|nr:hypothetical protein [Opitutaceae bacterium]
MLAPRFSTRLAARVSNGAQPTTAGLASTTRGFSRACHVAAVAITVLWFCVYSHFRKDGLCDEAGHMGILYHYAEAKAGLPDNLTTPPGYHFVVLALSRGHPNDTWARFTTLLFALLGLVAFSGAWREFHRRPAGAATLLFALLPIMQPFAGMAYSDVPGLAILLWAWWAQLRGQFFAAGALLTISCLIRQTNVVWGAFFVAAEITRASAANPDWRASLSTGWQRGRWLLLVIASAVLVVVVTGRFTPSANHGNEFKPNIATLYLGGLLVLFLGAPVWASHVRGALGEFRQSLAKHRLRTGGAVVAAIGLVALLTAAFANPHPWNQALSWPETTFTLLRNWPLVYAGNHFGFRVFLALGVVLASVALARLFSRQTHARLLWLMAPFAVLLLATNSLVDPRYFITPAVFLLFFLEVDRRSFGTLAVWFGVICAVHAPFIVLGRALW